MFNIQRTASIILLITAVFAFFVTVCDALIIVPPSSKNDWEEIATLLVETFDDTISPNKRASPRQNFREEFSAKCQEAIEELKWNYIEKPLTEQYTYNQYVANARRMIGKKYALYVAKEKTQSEDNASKYMIVGMIEVGMTIKPSSNDKSVVPKPTLGVLAVNGAFRNRGIGQQLLEKCQDVVTNVWKEENLYVQVEPENEVALHFFKKNAYQENGEIVHAKVARRRSLEERPHLVLSKQLTCRQKSSSNTL
jgi:ribosomal protein S18 acetylase RimI-like enzyme